MKMIGEFKMNPDSIVQPNAPCEIVRGNMSHKKKLDTLQGLYMLGEMDRAAYLRYRKQEQNKYYYERKRQQILMRRGANNVMCPTCARVIAKSSVTRHNASASHLHMTSVSDSL